MTQSVHNQKDNVVSPEDRAIVEELLGRQPQGHFEIAVRSALGSPVVLANAPLLDDGRPMPTRYWLVDKALVKAIGQLESSGGVNQAEAEVDEEELDRCHKFHGQMRNDLLPDGHEGPTPYGGVGGTRKGVKCLHAHYANFLAGQSDPVGVWVDNKLRTSGKHFSADSATEDSSGQPVDLPADLPADLIALYRTAAAQVDVEGSLFLLHLGVDQTVYLLGDGQDLQTFWRADVSGSAITSSYLDSDPPKPEELSAAMSVVELHVKDAQREMPELTEALPSAVVLGSGDVHMITAVEQGVNPADLKPGAILSRKDAEDLFRTVVVEPEDERRHNPGLPTERVGDIIGLLCVLLKSLRQLDVDHIKVASEDVVLESSDGGEVARGVL